MKIFDHQLGQYLSVDTANIYYEVTGAKSKPVLLVLHGGFGTIEDLNGILIGLSKHFTLVGIDSRGHGKSTMGTVKLTYERIQKDVEQVLRHLNINTVSIIGFSDGGIVAYRLAAFSKLKIDKLVTIGSRWHYKNADTTRRILESVTAQNWKENFTGTYETYRQLNPEPNFDHLAHSLVKMWLNPGAAGYPSFNLQKYTSPLLIIRGDNDHLIKREVVVELANLMKDAALLNVPFAGHAAHTDQKEIIVKCLDEFLLKG